VCLAWRAGLAPAPFCDQTLVYVLGRIVGWLAAALAGRDRGVDAAVDTGHPDREAQAGTENREDRAEVVGVVGDDDDAGA
jgi:hypothetical protein